MIFTDEKLSNRILQHRKAKRLGTNLSLKAKLRSLYIPSWGTIIGLIVITFGFALINRSHIFSEWLQLAPIEYFPNLAFDKSSHYQNLIAIHAGIGSIIFALIILITQFLGDKKSYYKGKVLLSVTYLFPLTIAEILSFFLFIWGNLNASVILPIGIVAIGTIVAVKNAIHVLLSNTLMNEKSKELFSTLIERSINLAVDERIAHKELRDYPVQNDIKLSYNFFVSNKDSDYYPFICHKNGTVEDLNLSKLKEFSNLIEMDIYNQDSMSEQTDMITKERSTNGLSIETSKHTKIDSFGFILKTYHDEITSQNNTVIYINRNLNLSVKTIAKLQNLITKIFLIGKPKYFTHDAKAEIEDIKDSAISYINDGFFYKLENTKESYTSLIEAFLKKMDIYNNLYSREQAHSERTSIGGGWEEIEWLINDIKDVFFSAMNSKNSKVIDIVSSWPMKIGITAMRYHEHYVFQEFLDLLGKMYYHSLLQNKSIINQVTEDISTTAQWFVEIPLRFKYIENPSNSSLESFAIELMGLIQNIIKITIDRHNSEDFFVITKIINSLFCTQKIYSRDSQKGLASLKKIKFQKKQMVLGLTAWTLRASKDLNLLQKLLDLMPGTLSNLTELWLKSRSHKTAELWGWDGWRLSSEYTEVHWDNTILFLDQTFVLKALQLLSTNSAIVHKTEIENIKLSFKIQIPTADVNQAIEDMQQRTELITVKESAVIESLKSFISALADSQNNRQKDVVIKTSISLSKVSIFKEMFVQAFREKAKIRNMLNYYGKYIELLHERNDSYKGAFGIDRIVDKQLFFKKWYESYSGFAEAYGHDLANFENSFLFEEILKHSELQTIDSIDEVVRKIKNTKLVFITCNSSPQRMFSRKDNLISRIESDTTTVKSIPDFLYGWYKVDKNLEIPVYQIFIKGKRDILILLELDKLPILKQLSPTLLKDDIALQYEIFHASIYALSDRDDVIDKYLNSSSPALIKLGDREDQKKFLQGQARIEIYEKVDFSNENTYWGHQFKID